MADIAANEYLEYGNVSSALHLHNRSHLPWRPLNLNVSFQRQFQLPAILFTQQMKNLYVPENIVGEFLHA